MCILRNHDPVVSFYVFHIIFGNITVIPTPYKIHPLFIQVVTELNSVYIYMFLVIMPLTSFAAYYLALSNTT